MRSAMLALTLLACAFSARAAEPVFSGEELAGFFAGSAALRPDEKGATGTPPPPPPGTYVDATMTAGQTAVALAAYGREPKYEELQLLDAALKLLQKTPRGSDLCEGLTQDGCDAAKFQINNIEIRVKPMADALAFTPAYTVGNKKVITVDPVVFTKRYLEGDLASILGHELSHVKDVLEHHSPLLEARLMTEKKAYLAELEIYTQIYERNREVLARDTRMHMMMLAWHRQMDKDATPRTAMVDGKLWSVDDFIRKNLQGSDNPAGFVHAMTTFYYSKVPAVNWGQSNMPISLALRDDLEDQLAAFAWWRNAHPWIKESAAYPLAPPAPPANPGGGQPQTQTGGGSGGSANHGNGGFGNAGGNSGDGGGSDGGQPGWDGNIQVVPIDPNHPVQPQLPQYH